MTYRIHVDFETRSVAELARQNAVGEHAYAQHETTDPLLLAYYTDAMERVEVAKLYKNTACPTVIREAIADDAIFVAHNARFEQAIWHWQMHEKYGWDIPKRWSCTAARARYWGLRASLDGAGSDLEISRPKDSRGTELIKLFCKPRKWKKHKVTGVRSIVQPWYEPHEKPDEWAEFVEYCARDVEAEIDIDNILPDLPDFEQANWELDYKMNWRGLPLDMKLVRRAIQYCDHFTNAAVTRFNELTGGLNPTQRDRVLEYLQAREADIDNLRSKTLRRINRVDFEPELLECVDIRLQAAMAAVKKLQAMERCTTGDGLARGLILYYGAHTGRDSGKRIQPQNFKRGNKRIQEAMFRFLAYDPYWENGDWPEVANIVFARPLEALALSMRGFITAPKGTRFVIADYAQVEARVLAWLANATKKMGYFRDKVDVYCKFAGVLYNRAYEDYFDELGKIYEQFAFERQVAKSAELGCGFGLGAAAFVEYCDNMDIIIDEETAKKVIKTWRADNPEICEYWDRVEKAAKLAVANEGKTYCVGKEKRVRFHIHRIDVERFWLVCTLPSERHIAYYRPKLRAGLKWGKVPVEILSFRTEWNGKSYREDTYGGKLVENIVQGTARDIMKVGVQNAENAGYKFIMPVHDEGIFIRPIGEGSHEELERLMCDLPEVYATCPITAEGHECLRYTK